MNDEIKEILDYLKDEKWDYYPSDMTPYKVLLMEERDKLLDYITNLQQENQELNDSITWWTNRFNAVQRDYEDYKSRIEKVQKIINIEKKKMGYAIYDSCLLLIEEAINGKE